MIELHQCIRNWSELHLSSCNQILDYCIIVIHKVVNILHNLEFFFALIWVTTNFLLFSDTDEIRDKGEIPLPVEALLKCLITYACGTEVVHRPLTTLLHRVLFCACLAISRHLYPSASISAWTYLLHMLLKYTLLLFDSLDTVKTVDKAKIKIDCIIVFILFKDITLR